MHRADLDRAVFLVGAPFAGEGTLLLSLAHASGVWHSRGSFLDELDEVEEAARQNGTHRLTAADAEELGGAVRESLTASLVDREGRSDGEAGGVAIAAGARLALRIPFLAAAFPEARFVFVARAQEEVAPEMLAAWRDGAHVSAPWLDGWDGPPWSLPLIPGWEALRGRPLEDVVAEQWRAIDAIARADLEALPPERRLATDHAQLVADPRAELQRLCAALAIPYDQALLGPFENERRTRAAAAVPQPEAAFGSVSTASFAQALAALNSSLLVSTYQTGKLICAREQGGRLNTHFRPFDKPMGIAVADGRFCLGTRTEVWDVRDVPAVAPKVEPAGTHDACYIPRNRHVTGDIAVHEMAFAGGELWLVATAFSCLATLDAHHSFVPRWKPPFVSEVGPGDRCHLNGMAVVDDAVRYVTALGQTDEPGGWRAGKASGGVILDVSSNEVVIEGLSMPHSPRWHDGRLWVLESGRGELCVVDLERGTSETVAELPGFTRGLAFAGGVAFVGLSQIRESSTFGDLPLTQRLSERLCGVWMVELASGRVAGFLRFDDLVQEVFDVALLTGKRYPEIAEMGSTAVAASYVLP